jgi:hypothetical protein
MITKDEADMILTWIEALEERTNVWTVLAGLEKEGFTREEFNRALKSLGKIAGRDAGLD